MISTVHERPGVYSSYEVSSVLSANTARKTVGVAAAAAKGETEKVMLLTSYAQGVEMFGEDAEGAPGMATLLKLLFANGAFGVKAVAVAAADGTPDYEAAFALLNEEEDVEIIICDSADAAVHALLRTAVESASNARRERIAVVGGAGETVAQMIAHAQGINSERVVLVGPDIVTDGGETRSAVFAAAAVAGAIACSADASTPINGAQLAGIAGVAQRFSDNDIDILVRGGVTPLECVGGVCSPVRGITTRTKTGSAEDATWRELTTILVVDDVIPAVRSALRARFSRSKNTAQARGAIRSQVVLELEKKLSAELIDSYGEVSVSALESDPTVCLVEFGFTVAHGLNRIYLTAHITV